ncbi:MAG: HAD family phosphatase, partial [Candidatus Wildermuthbacteria bacterium]|nr:HAD family phosphatase [Candidatus Wildermuthbacteria bacterium]
GWNAQVKPIYKMFTCDECGKNMVKAWHVWANLKGLLAETHFCKKCGERLGFSKIIKGVIYDLDGTLISTLKLHRAAWLAAGKKFGIPVTEKMLQDQTGMSDETAALMMLPKDKKQLLLQFVEEKQEQVRRNINKVSIFPRAMETINGLLQKGYKVWICTSAYKFFVEKVLSLSSALRIAIKDNVVWREMYKRAKPAPDALDLTIKKMRLKKSQACYVGDAFKDYKTSASAKVKFIYFCPNVKNRDSRIPQPASGIASHREIFKLL